MMFGNWLAGLDMGGVLDNNGARNRSNAMSLFVEFDTA